MRRKKIISMYKYTRVSHLLFARGGGGLLQSFYILKQSQLALLAFVLLMWWYNGWLSKLPGFLLALSLLGCQLSGFFSAEGERQSKKRKSVCEQPGPRQRNNARKRLINGALPAPERR